MITWGPMCWRHLDAASAQELWNELIDWVEWLRHRYELTQSKLPACWPFHPVAVEELTALMAGYTASYQALTTKDGVVVRYHDQMIVWHRLELWSCLSRIREHANTGGCTVENCSAKPRPLSAINAGVREFVANDVRVRRIDREVDVLPEAVMAQLVAEDSAHSVDGGMAYDGAMWVFDSHIGSFVRQPSDH
ncbi:hypothetical protein [Gordonia rubripertincta]|uniref:Uncharacterized protein n=1 Tax=Gordonia rubripertincta TaxID=36822 RepID=A0ABT4N5L2_GORRU|nr:hypothetical protein [Gordonia rubripertincta]MCZ4553651.1 hypothetical protein [Gordonia rubripertincta]